MDRVVLERHESSDQGTFGRIYAGPLTFFTLELPWRDNAPNVSCIPVGDYRCDWTLSPRFRRLMIGVGPVKGRSGVRVHASNFAGDRTLGFLCQLNGCISLGEKVGKMSGQKALLLSAPAVRRFEMHMQHKSFQLEIKDCA